MISEEDIPENWEIKPIKDVATINPRISISERDNYAYVPMSAVNPDIQQIDSYERKDNIYSGLSKFKDGDVIIAKITPCFENKNIAIVNNIPQGYDYAVGSSELVVFRPTEISKKYLFNYLRSKYVMDWGENRLIGSTGRERIKISQFRNELYIPVPPKEEQERIVSYIERELNWVEELEKSTSLLREYFTEYKKSLLNTVFTGETDMSKQTPTQITEDSIPENWDTSNLKSLVSLESGSRPKGSSDSYDSDIPSIGGSEISGTGEINITNPTKIPKDYYDSMNTGKINHNDILLVKDGANTGDVAIYSEEFGKAAVNSHAYIIRLCTENIKPEFLYYYLRSEFSQSHIQKESKGAAQKGINMGFADNLIVPIPPLDEQTNIINKIKSDINNTSTGFETINKFEDYADEYKESVLSSAFKGNIDY